ncbi:MAG: ACT domain-containing protein, partial [Chloroflexota bacterium]
SGIKNLDKLLKNMSPTLQEGVFVFISLTEGTIGSYDELNPIAAVVEPEGLTLVIPQDKADQHQISYDGVYKMITLEVHSSLEAVGLTAAFATKLAEHHISANVIAGFYHDHIFVQASAAARAIAALKELSA